MFIKVVCQSVYKAINDRRSSLKKGIPWYYLGKQYTFTVYQRNFGWLEDLEFMSFNKLNFSGSANHQESNEKEEEMAECQQNQQNCSMCRKFISNKQSNESNIKCDECMGKMTSISSSFPFEMVIET